MSETELAAPAGREPARIETLEHAGLTWLLVDHPGPAELAALERRFGFEQPDLEDLVSPTERPKQRARPGYDVVILHFPVVLARPTREAGAFRRLTAAELHLFVGPDYVVTVHDGDLRPILRLLAELRESAALRDTIMVSAGRLTYAIVKGLIEGTARETERLVGSVEVLQEEIFAETGPDPIRRLVAVRRELSQLRRMIDPDVAVLARIGQARLASSAGLIAHWDDALDQIERQADVLADAGETLEALSRGYDQIVAYRTNRLIRALTLVATLMLPLAVIAGVYGMNVVGLPFAQSEWAFEIVLALMLAVAFGLVALFRRRGWI